MKRTIWILLIAIFLVAGCSSQPNNETNNTASQQEAAALIYTAAAMTAEANGDTPQEVTPQPEATQPLPPTPTELPAFMASVSVELNGLILRAGPGTAFESLATFAEGTRVTTLGMIPDGTWIKVRAPLVNGGTVDGWMFAQYLDLTLLVEALPVETLSPLNTISGVVSDLDGNPASDVRVAAFFQTENGEVRDESTTNHEGTFEIYYPAGLTDDARVEIVAVNCSSNISGFVTGGCQVLDYFPVHWRETIPLPQAGPLTFTYEKASTYLEGKVVYQDGNGASEILIKATRQSDGVESEQVTPVGGAFRLPLGPGTWEVVAVRFRSDGTPLIGETRIYEIGTTGEELDPLTIPYVEIIER